MEKSERIRTFVSDFPSALEEEGTPDVAFVDVCHRVSVLGRRSRGRERERKAVARKRRQEQDEADDEDEDERRIAFYGHYLNFLRLDKSRTCDPFSSLPLRSQNNMT